MLFRSIRMGYLSPQAILNSKKQYAADLEEKLQQRMHDRLVRQRHQIELLAGCMEAGSPVKKLSQGYSFVTDSLGSPVTKIAQVGPGDRIDLRTLDGKIQAEVLATNAFGEGEQHESE